MFGRIMSRALALAFVVFALGAATFAQDLDDVSFAGKITDSNGAAIAGATVTARSIDLGVERTVTTDEDGRYRIIELKPGTYKVKAVAPGFGIQETPEIVTISAQNVLRDFKLAPADIRAEQTITVTDDDVPAVDPTRTIVGGTVTQREIEELPNTNRDALDLVFTLGGVTEEPLSNRDLSLDKGGRNESAPSSGLLEGGVFALSGGAAYSNNITIDGFDNNDDRVAGIRFQPSVESIAEVWSGSPADSLAGSSSSPSG